MWCSNQLVDLLADDSAESIRATKAFRDSLVHKEAQLADLAMFIGKLTHEANSWIGPDGVKMRDSEALPKRLRKSRIRSKRCSRLVCKPRKDSAKAAEHALDGGVDWQDSWAASCAARRRHQLGSSCVTLPSRASRDDRAQVGIAARQEAAFQSWWRESRSQLLQPRSTTEPSAAAKLEALRQRVAARAGN